MKRPRLKVQHNKTDGSVGDAGPDQEKRGGGDLEELRGELL